GFAETLQNKCMSAEEAKPVEAGGGGGAPASSGSSKLVLILSGVNLLLTLGMAGVLFSALKKEQAKPSVEDMVVEEKAGDKKAVGEHGGGEHAAGGEHGGGEH